MKILAPKKPHFLPAKMIAPPKLIFIMKLSFLIMTSVLFSIQFLIASPGSAQKIDEVKVTVALNGAPLKFALGQIEKQTSFRFAYVEDRISGYNNLYLSKEERTLSKTLSLLLENTSLKYTVKNNIILLLQKADPIPDVFAVQQYNTSADKIFLASISGIVRNESQELLSGVSIIEKGTNNGTTSNDQGKYSLQVSEGATLVFSYAGYVSREVAVGNRSVIDVEMVPDVKQMDDVVVIGYGTQKKTDLTGAVASANLKAFSESPNVNLLQSLQGSVPGITIGQTNRPGQENSINIRGTSTLNGRTSPLIVVDGMMFSGRFSDINPNDVASVEVLKDASSKATYGSLAANGVILVTTKPGIKGKPRFNYSGFVAFSSPTNKAQLLGRDEYLHKVRDINWRDSYTAASGYIEMKPGWGFNNSAMNPPLIAGIAAGNDFDWYGEATRQAIITSHTISASGGTDKTTFYMSAGYSNDKGFIINDDFKRWTLRLNIDNKITNWLSLGANISSTFSDRSGDAPNMSTIIRSAPLVLPRDGNGDLIVNPVADNNINAFFPPTNDNLEKNNRIVGNFYGVISFPWVDGLTYKINYGNNSIFSRNHGSSTYGAGQTGSAFKNNAFSVEHTLDNIVNYTKQKNKHGINATFLYGYNTAEFEGTEANGQGFTDLDLSYNNLALAQIQRNESSAWKESLQYQMMRVGYNYDGKYLLTATLRRDGFSGFSKNNKTALFPSIGLGWAISEEDFFKTSIVDYLKIRASYGENGNRVSRYSSLARVQTPLSSWYVFGDGSSPSVGRTVSSLANNDLRWEKTAGINVGMDFKFLRNRISGNIEYYNSKTKDLLWAMVIPETTGFSSVLSNIGELNNKGIELFIQGTPVKTVDFTWDIGFNFTRNINKVVSLLGRDNDGDGKEDDLIASGLFIGRSIGTIYNYQVDGIWQVKDNLPSGFQPGSYRVIDQNKDGSILPENDRAILGYTEPAYLFGIQNTMLYKQFTFRFFINSIQGGKNGYMRANQPTGGMDTPGNATNSNWFNFYDYWSPTRPNAKYANPWEGSPVRFQAQQYQQRSFVRLQDISLSYSITNALANRAGFKNAKIFVSGKNLLTFTNWEGWDPETGQGITSTDAFPLMKSYSVGIDLAF